MQIDNLCNLHNGCIAEFGSFFARSLKDRMKESFLLLGIGRCPFLAVLWETLRCSRLIIWMREMCAAIQPVTRSVCDNITGSSAEWFEPLDGKQRVACYISFSLHKSSCIKSYIKSKANHLCTLHWTDTAIQWKLCIWIWHLIFSCNIHFSAHVLCL